MSMIKTTVLTLIVFVVSGAIAIETGEIIVPFGGETNSAASKEFVTERVNANTDLINANAIDIARNEQNIFINAFHDMMNDSLSARSMADGFTDAFEDQLGVATGEGSNFIFSTDKYTFEEISGSFASGLDLLLKCDENAANKTVLDSSGQGNDGVSIRNTSLMNATGKIGDGFDLVSASLDDITFAVFGQGWHGGLGTTSLTISAQIALDNWTGTDNVFHRSQVSGVTPMFIAGHYQTAVTTFRMADDSNDQVNLNPTEALSFVNGSFHNVIYMWDAATDTVTVFMDGVQVITGSNSSIDAFTGWQSSQALTFGARNRNGAKSLHMDGIIDAIYKWNRTITTNEVRGLDNLGAGTESLTYVLGGALEIRSAQSSFFTTITNPTASVLTLVVDNKSGFALNTDFRGYTSNDNGTNWIQVTLVDDGVFENDFRLFSGTNALTFLGTNIRWRVTATNAAVGELNAVGVLLK